MTDKKKPIKRTGVNIIEIAMDVIEQGTIVTEDGIVLKSYPFIEEEPMTEWITDTIIIRLGNDDKPRIYKDEQLLR